MRVFAQLSLEQLLRELDLAVEEGTYTTPTATFDRVLWSILRDENPVTVETFKGHTCRSVHIDFVGERKRGREDLNEPVTVSVVQATRDPVTATAPVDEIAGLDAALVPGETWSIVARHDKGYNSIFFNGSASCY